MASLHRACAVRGLMPILARAVVLMTVCNMLLPVNGVDPWEGEETAAHAIEGGQPNQLGCCHDSKAVRRISTCIYQFCPA